MALREINLIPDDLLFRKKLFHSIFFWSFVLASLLLIISGYCAYQIKSAQENRPDLFKIAQIKEELQSKVEMIKSTQKKYNRLLQKKDSLLAPLQQLPVSLILYKIAENLNKRIWLQQIEILSRSNKDDQDSFRKIKLEGESLSHINITKFMQALQEDLVFQDLELNYARTKKGESIKTEEGQFLKVIQFQIQGRFGHQRKLL